MAHVSPPVERILLAHFIVSADVERSWRFYTEVLGGRVVFSGGPTYVTLANSWIIIDVGGGPTDDKPTMILETPTRPRPGQQLPHYPSRRHPGRVRRMERPGCSVLSAAEQHQYEIRCYIRDPDGYLIEVGQTTTQRGLLPVVLKDPKCPT